MVQVLDYLQLKERFETDGVFDESLSEVQSASTQEIETYKKYANKYEQTPTNLYYWYGDEDGNLVLTNMEGDLAREEAYDQAILLGRYLRYDMSTFHFETNVGGMEKNYYEDMARYNSLSGNNTTLIVAVDVNFPENDDFSVAKKEFDKLYPWAKRSIVLVVASAVLWLFCMCYMTVAAGKRSEDREVHLFPTDRIPTEIPAICMVAALGFLAFLGTKVHQQDYEIMGRMVVTGTFALLGAICFMGMYLSLVRRVKADTFFANSYMNWFYVNLKDTWNNKYVGNRRELKIIGIMAVFLVLSWLSFGRRYLWSFVLLGILVVFVLIYSSQRIIQRNKILEGINRITQGDLNYKLNMDELKGDERLLAEGINHISEGLATAISESVQDERMKASMITNISHDIKTPLTSIINYIGLLRREEIHNPKAQTYIDVLEQKSLRLKQLMDDLVEVSRISSGNVTLQMTEIDLVELVRQTGGEFNEKLEQKGLNVITKFPKESVMICADGRQLWRVIGNLYNNVAKYAMPDTRVYVEVAVSGKEASFSMKNISESMLDVNADSLTERFVRGDESRSTEGSGLGLSISKMLTELMGGQFDIELEDDLFRVKVTFQCEIA
jgi:signal transduction histidine kinase